MAELGAHVIINHRTAGSGSGVLDTIRRAGGSAEAIQADIFRRDELRSMLAEIRQRRPVDILVANAAADHRPSRLLPLPAEVLADKVAGDIFATHELTVTLAPAMRERGWGRLVYIRSRHSQGPAAPGMAANGISKAALAACVRYVTDELTGSGLTANLVEPGFVATDRSWFVGDRVPALITDLTPAGRTAKSADIAER